jgi:hypothetical protein
MKLIKNTKLSILTAFLLLSMGSNSYASLVGTNARITAQNDSNTEYIPITTVGANVEFEPLASFTFINIDPSNNTVTFTRNNSDLISHDIVFSGGNLASIDSITLSGGTATDKNSWSATVSGKTMSFTVPPTNNTGTVIFSYTSSINAPTNTAPIFIKSSPISITINEDSANNNITEDLNVSDTDSSQTIIWDQKVAPSKGILTLTSATSSSGTTNIKSGGSITYTPTTDLNGSDTFDINVSDGTATDTITVNITINNTNDTPIISSNGGGATASIATLENNASTITTVIATDKDSDIMTYSKSGIDSAQFNINSSTGVLTFTSAPDYENPTDSGANNIYDVTVTATDGNSTFDSQNLTITVTNVNETPISPNGFTIKSSNGTITLNWNDVTSESGYKIYVSTDGVNFDLNTTTPLNADITTYQLTNLPTDTTYYFKVIAFNGDGESNSTTENNSTAPSTPTNLVAFDSNASQINLKWSDVSNSESGYELNTTLSANSTEYNVTNLDENTTYYFKVGAYNSGGESNASANDKTNDKPNITIFTNKTLNEDFGTDTSLVINTINDSDNDQISLTVESNDTSIFTFAKSWGELNITSGSYNISKTITLTSEANKSGVVELNVTAYDGKDYINNIFNVNINAVNDTPIVNTNATLTVQQGRGGLITTSYLSSSDVDNNTSLIYTIISAPTNGTLYKVSTHTALNTSSEFNQTDLGDINYTHSGNSNFIDGFTFNVKDQSGATTSNYDFNITVIEINNPVTFDVNVTDIKISEGASAFNISLININDPESKDLNISIESNDTTMFVITQNWNTNIVNSSYTNDLNFTISPYTNAFGKAELNVTVDDGVNKTVKEFNITITDTPDNPKISTISNISKGINFSDFNVSINTYDPDRGEMNVSIDINDTSLIDYNATWYDSSNEYNVTYNETCESNSTFNNCYYKDLNLTIKSKPNVDGFVRVTIKAEDNVSGEVSKTFDINVSADNLVLADLNEISLTTPTTTNLTLPSIGSLYDSNISWSSNNSATISNSGVVTRNTSNTTVILTATANILHSTFTKSFSVIVTGTNPTTTGGLGGGGFISSSSDNTGGIKLQISNSAVKNMNIKQDTDNTTNEQIFKNSEILDDGTKADTQIKIGEKELNLNISINGKDTKIKTPSNIELSMDNKGNSTLKIDKDIEVIAKRDGKVEVKSKDFYLEIKSNGANLVVSEDKTITISKETIIDNKITIATIEIQPNGEVKASITNSNGIKYDFNFPQDSNSKGAIFDGNALVGKYKALSGFFVVKDKTYTRGITFGDNYVKIEPKNSETLFEEKLYFNKNYRVIILRSGEADLIIDGNSVEMEQDKEYVIIVQNNNKAILNTIYRDNYLIMTEGWSLISSPIESEINVSDSFYNSKLNYKFENQKWIKDSKILKSGEGMWLKSDFDAYIYLDKYNTNKGYDFNQTRIIYDWNLFGSGSDLALNSDEFEQIWAFDNISKIWVKNPNTIKRGYGFWAKYVDLQKVYIDSYLNIKQGWNLISNPVNKPLNIAETFKYTLKSYKYKNGEWIKNPETLNQNEGMWIDYNSTVSEKIEGESYDSNFTNLSTNWNLVGVSKDTNLSELSQFEQIWAFDSNIQKWFKNPKTIYKGYGFWAK